MPDKPNSNRIISDRALEMVMRDVLDGMEEATLESAFNRKSSDLKILSITPLSHEKKEEVGLNSNQRKAEVIYPLQFKKQAS